jgi:hypothetical protein
MTEPKQAALMAREISADVIVAAVAAEDAVGFQNGHAAIPIGIGLTAYRNVSKFDT